MSYCRFVESDVYIFEDNRNTLVCCYCSLKLKEGNIFPSDFTTTSRSKMLSHLREHQEHGDYVPEDVFIQLEQERLVQGDTILNRSS